MSAQNYNIFGDFLRSVNSPTSSSDQATTDADDLEGRLLKLAQGNLLTVENALSATGAPLSLVLKVLDKLKEYGLIIVDRESGRIELTERGTQAALSVAAPAPERQVTKR